MALCVRLCYNQKMTPSSLQPIFKEGFRVLDSVPRVRPSSSNSPWEGRPDPEEIARRVGDWLGTVPPECARIAFLEIGGECVTQRQEEAFRLLLNHPNVTNLPPLDPHPSSSVEASSLNRQTLLASQALMCNALKWGWTDLVERMHQSGHLVPSMFHDPKVMLAFVRGHPQALARHAHKKMFVDSMANLAALKHALDLQDRSLFDTLVQHIPFSSDTVKQLLLPSLSKGETRRWSRIRKHPQWGPKAQHAFRSESNSINVLRACLEAPTHDALKCVLAEPLSEHMKAENIPASSVVLALTQKRLPVVEYALSLPGFKKTFDQQCCPSTLMYQLLHTPSLEVLNFAAQHFSLPWSSSCSVLEQLAQATFHSMHHAEHLEIWSMVMEKVDALENLRHSPSYVWTCLESWLLSDQSLHQRSSLLRQLIDSNIYVPFENEDVHVLLEKARLEKHLHIDPIASSTPTPTRRRL